MGTSSYGAAPVGLLTDNSEEEDIDDVRRRIRRNQKGSGLRKVVSASSGRSSGRSADRGSGSRLRRIPFRTSTSQLRRKSISGPSGEWQTGGDAGFGARYGAGGLPISIETTLELSDSSKEASYAFEGSERSSEEAITVEDTSTSDDEDTPDNSPYPQVRASVSAVDDTTLSINIPRMWTLSLLFVILGSSTNLLSLRYPSVAITPVIALLLVHPLGLLMDQLLKRLKDSEEVFVDSDLMNVASGPVYSELDTSAQPLAAPATGWTVCIIHEALACTR